MSLSKWRTVTMRAVVIIAAITAVTLPTTSAGAIGHQARASAVKTGGTVIINYGPKGSWTRNFNPFANTPADGTQAFIYEPLFMFNNAKGGKIMPWLATKYKWGKGNKSLTFTLRSGVKWNDGKPFTSADVKFSVDLAKKFPAIACGSCWTVLSSISTPNSTTVVFNFKTVNTTMLYFLGNFYPVPEHAWKSVSDPVKYTNPSPVATGPFKLGSFSPQVYTLVKNKYFWQKGKPYVDALRFPAFTGNDSAQLALVKGEVDWAGLLIPNIKSVYASKDPNNKYWFTASGSPVSIWLNDASAPFNNVHVRRAVSYAIDRNAISKVGEYGYAPAANSEFVIPTYVKKWANTSSSAMGYAPSTANVSKAKAELALAKGVDYSKPMTLTAPAGWNDWDTDLQLIATELNAVGFHVTAQPLEFGAYLNNLQVGKFDLALSWMGGGPSPYYLYRDDFTSTASAPIGQTAATNFSRYSNSKLDSLLSQYSQVSSTSKQIAIMKQAEAIAASDMPVVPVFVGDQWNEYSTRHFVGWPDAKNAYDIGSPYALGSNEDVILHVHSK